MSAALGAADHASSTVACQVPQVFGSKFMKSNAFFMMGVTAGARARTLCPGCCSPCSEMSQ